jgi:hypothetical protein
VDPAFTQGDDDAPNLEVPENVWIGLGATKTIEDGYIEYLNIGRMTQVCSECGANHFQREPFREVKRNRSSSRRTYLSCCRHGKVNIPDLAPPPQPIRSLLLGQNHKKTKHFMDKVKVYNAQFTMCSYPGKRCLQEMPAGQHFLV